MHEYEKPLIEGKIDLWEYGHNYSLPNCYNDTYLTLMIRDPYYIFAYWEIEAKQIENFKQRFGPLSWKTSLTAIELCWSNSCQIVTTNENTNSLYFFCPKEKGIPLYGRLGRILPDNTFLSLAISNYLPLLGKNIDWLYGEKTEKNELNVNTTYNWTPYIYSN